MLNARSSIAYLIIQARRAALSPFVGADVDLLDNLPHIATALMMPARVEEAWINQGVAMALRRYSALKHDSYVVPVDLEHLADFPFEHFDYLYVDSHDASLVDTAVGILHAKGKTPFVLQATERGGIPERVEEIRTRLVRYLLEHPHTRADYAPRLAETLNLVPDPKGTEIVPRHQCTLPNVICLRSVGHNVDVVPMAEFVEAKLRESLLINDPWREASLLAFDVVERRAREMHLPPDSAPHVVPGPGIVLVLPSLFLEQYTRRPSAPQSRLARVLHRVVSRQAGWAFSLRVSDISASELDIEVLQFALARRAEEAMLCTVMAGAVAARSAAATLRLPYQFNLLQPQIKVLQRTYQSSLKNRSRKWWKTSKAFLETQQRMGASLPNGYLERIAHGQTSGFKLVSSAPLEWLDCGGLPLMLLGPTSRIPTAPPDLLARVALGAKRELLPLARFRSILVVRSFEVGDPVAWPMKAAFDEMFATIPDAAHSVVSAVLGRREADVPTNLLEPVHFSTVTVRTVDEFISAISNFAGGIVVVDAHGSPAGIKLEEGVFDPWKYLEKLRAPPIVLLSSCHTHAFTDTHFVPASGFLAAGARTVLAPAFNVNAIHSAKFIARLTWLATTLLPLFAYYHGQRMSWGVMVFWVQRMMVADDITARLSALLGRKVDEEYIQDLALTVLLSPAASGINFARFVVEALSAHFALNTDVVRGLIHDFAQLTDALLYVQLGDPELLIIDPRDRHELFVD